MNDAPTPTATPAADPAIDEPWLLLGMLIDDGDAGAVQTFLDDLPAWEQARAVSRLADVQQARLLELLPHERTADLMEIVSVTQAVELIDQLGPERAAEVISDLRSDKQADVLGELPERQADAILAELDPREAEQARALAEYDPRSAGGIMVTEYLAYYHSLTVADVIEDMREHADRYADYAVQYAYVVNTRGELLGVLRFRDLLFSPKGSRLSDVMLADPTSVRDDASLDALRQFFDDHGYLGVPVVDARGHLVGVVQRSAVDEAAEEQAQSMFLKISGIIGGEEFRTMPVWVRSGRRLSWLSINIVLNIIAASVIAIYTDTLEAAIALAIFLPMISDMSGCSGNQAVAVSMREITLGLLNERELTRVALKELMVGIINGLCLGLILGLIAFLWKSNLWLGLVVGGALALNTLVAVILGGSLPLVLKRARLDPAMVSSPVLTTVTDMCGFFLVLSFASAVIERL